MLEDIRKNIQKLISLYERERQRSDELAQRLEQSEASNAAYRQQITELNSQIDNLRLAGAFMSGGDTSESKARLDKLIREIDKCIKLLEK